MQKLSQSQQEVVFIPNSGNAGDCLINASCYQVLDHYQLNWSNFNHRKESISILKDKLVILGGGGALVGKYPAHRDFVKQVLDLAQRCIILPSTIVDEDEFVEQLPKETILFVREQMSFNYLQNVRQLDSVYLVDDIVLYLDVEKLTMPKTCNISWRFWLKACWKIAKLIKLRLTSTKLSVFRQDAEATSITVPKTNFDLSAELEFGSTHRPLNEFVACLFLWCINRFDSVESNRLHACIAATMLGKKVTLFDNNYGKNIAVFQHSLSQFSNVKES